MSVVGADPMLGHPQSRATCSRRAVIAVVRRVLYKVGSFKGPYAPPPARLLLANYALAPQARHLPSGDTPGGTSPPATPLGDGRSESESEEADW
jgi:hypothetical protein